jgi:2-aminoadipate transaminase
MHRMPATLARRMARVKPSAIRELLRLGADPQIISFGGGYPDPALFPLEKLSAVFEQAIIGQGRSSLQYTLSTGMPRLREQIAERMARQGVRCSAENVLILQGAQQGLDLVAKMLVDRGDLIITENPTFLGALIAFNPYEPG